MMRAGMNIRAVENNIDLDIFYNLDKLIYKEYPLYRPNDSEIIRSLVEGTSLFCLHAEITPFLIFLDEQPAGRFLFIRDHNLPEYFQVAFFAALPGIPDLVKQMIIKARELQSGCKYISFGLNGHLNYGAGILLNKFDEAPIYELPYNPEYYQEYFKDLKERTIVTFRFRMKEFFEWGDKTRETADLRGITVRYMRPKQFKKDIRIYTELNNACFRDHPFWSDRTVEEDLELFSSLGPFFKEENLLFAEYQGKPVGFLLWLPDFNELTCKNNTLGPEHLKAYQNKKWFLSYRFSEIAVLPEFRGLATLALILEMLIPVQKLDCKYGEGGFIFLENKPSVIMTKRYLKRIFGRKIDPYRYMAVYECEL